MRAGTERNKQEKQTSSGWLRRLEGRSVNAIRLRGKACCVTVGEGWGCEDDRLHFCKWKRHRTRHRGRFETRQTRNGRRVSLNSKMHQGQRQGASGHGNARVITLVWSRADAIPQ